ncbi:MAG: hypothetical protein NVS2B8_04650 [Vulcanimicrobiaceae bacterium]
MIVSRRTSLVVLCAVALTGCGQGVPPVGNYATVVGRVTDARTGTGVVGATVTVNVILTATTDASGAFRVANVPTGPWQYSVTGPAGYGSAPPVDNAPGLAAGESRSLAITLVRR